MNETPTEHVSGRDPIRVLMVEDDPDDVRLMGEALADSRPPFRLENVSLLSEALKRLQVEDVDIILSDLSLPDSQGFDTFQRLRAACPKAPIIVLSGLDDESLAIRTVEAGAQDYLVKGEAAAHMLVRAIRYAIKRTELDNALADERNLLRSVIDNLPDSIYVKDVHGHYMLDNVAHSHSLKVAGMEDVVGKTVFDFFPEQVARSFDEVDQAVMKEGASILNREEPVFNGNGEKHWLSTSKMPLRNRQGKIIGLVGFGRDITARKRAEEQAATYNAELREKNTQLEDDLHMAREIQQAFLPQQYPSFPRRATADDSALHFYARYLPTTAVGGDFFHILPVSDTAAGVFICDVMGHGVRAALVTAIQRALVEELLELASEPGVFLTHINKALVSILKRTRTPMFASAFYLVADVSTGKMSYANAGHPPALHLRRDAGMVKSLTGADGARPGPVLGVFDDCKYTSYETGLEPHDLVMLFTDGLYEVEGMDSEYYDQSSLIASVRRRMLMPTGALFDETIDEIRQFSADHSFGDDVCLVGMEVARTNVIN